MDLESSDSTSEDLYIEDFEYDDEDESSSEDEVRRYLRANGRELVKGSMQKVFGYWCDPGCMNSFAKCRQKCNANNKVWNNVKCQGGHLPMKCRVNCCY